LVLVKDKVTQCRVSAAGDCYIVLWWSFTLAVGVWAVMSGL